MGTRKVFIKYSGPAVEGIFQVQNVNGRKVLVLITFEQLKSQLNNIINKEEQENERT